LANHTGDGKIKDNATYRLWASREGLDQFQTSLVFNDRLLHGATSILSELYGIGSALDDDESDGKDGEEDDSNAPKDLPNRPLSVDDIAARVDRLAKPFLADEEKEEDESPSSPDSTKPDNSADGEGGAQVNGEKDVMDKKYTDVRTAYEEFINAMLLPESAVTVQGMKNFVRNFAVEAASKKEVDDDDKLVQNMALAVNGHIRSSYESLATKNNSSVNSSNNTESDGQGQGRPDWDRRSLESFLYGQVKTVVDTTLDRILGNGSVPPSSSSPFLMTQSLFDKRLEELQFLQPSHLELKCLKDDSDDSASQTTLESLLEGPINALQSIESFYSPYEKLCGVLDVYHGVNTVLKNASKSLPMADDVISAMILVIVKASAAKTSTKTPLGNILRDLHFVENFALQEYKRIGQGEVEYAFTSLYGAVYFLQGVELDFDREESDGGNKSSSNRLFISNEELRRGLEKSRALAAKNNAKWNPTIGNNIDDKETSKGLISQGVEELLGESNSDGIEDISTGASKFVPNPRRLSVREVRAARLRGETLDLEWALRRQEGQPATKEDANKSPSRSVFTQQRHTYLGVRPENIKLSDLPRLLDEYRKLVLTNEQLLGEHQRANSKFQSERKRLRDEKHRRTLGEQALLL